MSIDKIFEALSIGVPRRRILAYLSKTDMTAGEIVQRFAEAMSQPPISSIFQSGECRPRLARVARPNVHYGLKEDALTGTLVISSP